jgi:tRNA A37 N6-isopentenylltransferase MiaA
MLIFFKDVFIVKFNVCLASIAFTCTLGKVNFWIFWISNIELLNSDWQKKTKGVFIYFHVFLPGNEFLSQKIDKFIIIMLKHFFLQIGQYVYQTIRNFDDVCRSYQNTVFKKVFAWIYFSATCTLYSRVSQKIWQYARAIFSRSPWSPE